MRIDIDLARWLCVALLVAQCGTCAYTQSAAFALTRCATALERVEQTLRARDLSPAEPLRLGPPPP